MSKVNLSAQHIASLKPLEVVKDDNVRQRFIDIASTLWGESKAEATYEREAIYFNRLIADSEKLRKCTPVSIFIAFIDLAVCGLSVEPGVRALAYLQPRGFKIGQNEQGKDVYEQRCTLTISGYGELIQRTRAGQILHADNPVIVYEGDQFSFADHDGRKSVEYKLDLKHNPAKPIACFMRITRADSSIDYAVMLEEGWKRLSSYSGKANKYWDPAKGRMVENPNALYSAGEGNSIDSGFLVAKCIKHAFSTYPKVRIGRGTVYEADQQQKPEDDYYGDAVEEKPAQPQRNTFEQQSEQPQGVTIDPSESEADNDGTF